MECLTSSTTELGFVGNRCDHHRSQYLEAFDVVEEDVERASQWATLQN